jgi:hypothetical protein
MPPALLALLVGSLTLSLSGPVMAADLAAAKAQARKEHDEYYEAVLSAMGIPYQVTVSSEGVKSFEWPGSDMDQLLEVNHRVSQYFFIKRECPGMALPLPSDPSRQGLSCTRRR